LTQDALLVTVKETAESDFLLELCIRWKRGETYEANKEMKKTFLFFKRPFTPVGAISALIRAVMPCKFSA
jgi:hypothetical protein